MSLPRVNVGAARRWIALLLAAVLLLAPSASSASGSRRGAGQYTNGSYSGVDGYIMQSLITMPNCGGHFVLSWIDVDQRDQTNIAFVQIGMHQGQFFGWPGNCSQVRMYAEIQDCGATVPGTHYGKYDLGAPPKPNYPVYVTRTGSTMSDTTCGSLRTLYQWAFRVGSFTSSPKQYAWIRASAGKANAQQEIYWDNGSPDNINTNWWGLNDQGQVSYGYSLAVYKTDLTGWNQWTSSISTTVFPSDPALTLVRMAYYYAFKVHD